uniref:phenylalanine--tRNA ligase n=1 Tax=Gelidium elegans TaxID=37200 RepID=A0A141SDP4_GELEL|nr:phenylalanyl-tRNA synthetase beta chain [Gelidium elegans]AMK96412.1 phenylalanyl-tRNA synthetase beta chain [Gelidium elegans]
MKFSWKSLNDLINLKYIQINSLASKLTLAGFEVEETIYMDYMNDYIIDIDIIANRQDIGCIFGLAKEISIILNIPLKSQVLQKDSTNYNQQHLHDTFHSSKSVLNIAIQQIKDIQSFQSPIWLKNSLIINNIEPSNTILDIIHYIYIKWGQDIHVLDSQSITHKPFDIRLIKLIQLNRENLSKNINKKLHTELIQYKQCTLSTNGYNINNQYAHKSSSSSIIIFSTILDPIYIKNNIINKKSVKHLRYSNRNHFITAYREAIQLITQFTNGNIEKEYSYHRKKPEQIINIHKNLIYNILGPLNNQHKTYLTINNIFNIFTQLQLQPEYKNHVFTLTIPQYRNEDMQRPIDIIEEIGRIYGFNKFTDNLPVAIKQGHIANNTKNIYKIRKIFRDIGLHEIKNYSLQKYNNKENINLYNPLTKDQSNLRASLLHNLIQTKKYNIKHRNKNIEGFEIGNVFYKKDQIFFHETTNIGGILGNTSFARQSWSNSANELTWFQAKGNIEELFNRLKANVEWVSFIQNNYGINTHYDLNIYDQRRSALLYNIFTKEHIGIFGELQKKFHDELNSNHTTYIFEMNINALSKTIRINNYLEYIIKPYSCYPSITRDISVRLKSNSNIADIIDSISKQNSKLIESIVIFDEYEKIIRKRKDKYISIRITYRAQNRTLNDTDITDIDNQINNIINSYA